MRTKILYTKVFNRKNKLNKDGHAPIEICACLNGKRRYFSTKIFIAPKDWDAKHKQLKNTTQTNVKYNKLINDFINRLEEIELTAPNNLGLSVLDEINKPTIDKNDFVAFVQMQIDTMQKSPATIKAYKELTKHLNNYKSKIYFTDLTFGFVESFNKYLLSTGMCQNSANKYLRILRATINSAINNGLIDANKYAFRNYKIKHIQTNRYHLTPEEIDTLENLKIDNELTKTIRDMYLFAVYTGLRYSDVIRITEKNIIVTGGESYLQITMQKTSIPLMIPLSALFYGKPKMLIDKYKDTDNNTIFPKIDNRIINNKLKELAQLADIKKNITFHTARHTTATYLLNKGVNIVIVQKLLGHTSVSTTEIYAKMLSTTIEKELKAINYN